MKRTSGFTLIELLIVVAIIAILAAIAVPNFLEAQMRSKVSRSKADLRSMATAVEAYSVDWQKYPMQMLVGQDNGNIADPWGGVPPIPNMPPAPSSSNEFYFSRKPFGIVTSVTTPVAYMTSIPLDPFFRIVPNLGPSDNPTRREFQWSNSRYSTTSQNTLNNFMLVYGEWRMWTGGPDGDRRDILLRSSPSRFEAMRIYDPTNGTVSKGDIWRTHLSPDGSRPSIPGVTLP